MWLLTPYIVKPNSVWPQYCVSWESSWPRLAPAGWPIDIVSNLFDPLIYWGSVVATSRFSELFCQQGYHMCELYFIIHVCNVCEHCFILANNAHRVMIQQKLRYQKR